MRQQVILIKKQSIFVIIVVFMCLVSCFAVSSAAKTKTNNFLKFMKQNEITAKDLLNELDTVNFKDDEDCDDIFKPNKPDKKNSNDCTYANNCNNHGKCIDGKCVCDEGWTNYDCSISLCLNFCSDHGKCSNGKCICDEGYSGEDCSIISCPNDCNKHGRCVVR